MFWQPSMHHISWGSHVCAVPSPCAWIGPGTCLNPLKAAQVIGGLFLAWVLGRPDTFCFCTLGSQLPCKKLAHSQTIMIWRRLGSHIKRLPWGKNRHGQSQLCPQPAPAPSAHKRYTLQLSQPTAWEAKESSG